MNISVKYSAVCNLFHRKDTKELCKNVVNAANKVSVDLDLPCYGNSFFDAICQIPRIQSKLSGIVKKLYGCYKRQSLP